MYPYLEKKGFNVSYERRLTIGFIFEIVAVLVMIGLQYWVDSTEKGTVSFLWQILYCFPVAIAEVLVAVSSIQFAYQVAPPEMKSILIAICSVFRSFGNVILIVLNLIFENFVQGKIILQLWIYVTLMVFNSVLFYIFIDTKSGKNNVSIEKNNSMIFDNEEGSGSSSGEDCIVEPSD